MSPKQSSFASKSVAGLVISAIKGMAMRAAAYEDVASLTWGLPSFQTPAHIREAVSGALSQDSDAGKYTLPDGLPIVREAIAETHAAQTGVKVCPNRNVVVTAGNMQGIKALLDTILESGDEVIVTDPCFASHLTQIRLCGGQPVFWPLDEVAGWSRDAGHLEALITPKTRAIVLVTPSNPTGTLFGRDDLLRIAHVAKENGLLVILDDPYSQFCFDDENAYFNLASCEAYGDHIAYLFTFSKWTTQWGLLMWR